MTDYVAIKFITGQDIVAELISKNDNDTITIKRAVYVIPDQTDQKKMNLVPFVAFVDMETPQEYKNKDIMIINKPYDAIIDMMTKNFSSIIQQSTVASNVSKLIL
jgi:hypothetical protein